MQKRESQTPSPSNHYPDPMGSSVTLRYYPRDEMASSAFTRRAHDSFTGGTVSSGRSSAIFQHPLGGGLTELNLGRDIQLLSPVKYSILPTRLPRPPLFYMVRTAHNHFFLPLQSGQPSSSDIRRMPQYSFSEFTSVAKDASMVSFM
ncbi:hypothetical protein SISSUDRAFT_555377 [Sistotremastrum suecicum HHB10207 ss-3]|uniref:Uncharacterized protein n=1 Tax=Sistotremastrum suecicum HHB10207 ss-3 TaxID=1314776 RepID=A0A166EVE6_9AGAM|nr:hypothetical protein SISSUDRAFT_555377 [Sistotremastrum suecicum HHB10207 ss-3]